MCDRYHYEYGYICDECFNELVSLGVHQDIDEFMQARNYNSPPFDVAYQHFNNIFSIES